jgi:urease accessory protein
LRLARAAWDGPHVHLAWADLGSRPHHPLVLGCAARAAGLGPPEAALAAAYLVASAAGGLAAIALATAAVRRAAPPW